MGVLRVLEELRVPVDRIAGTSIGAVVGGLYASGLSPDEIEEALAEVDWERVLSDKPPREYLDFRRREEGRRYLFEIELGIKDSRLVLPGGLIAGQPLGQLLRRQTFLATGIEDFDSLPIPFRAVATDIYRGEQVVLDHGDLARALRASMSIPVVFAPVEVDRRLLVDGGLKNNLPVDVARAMGADVVIAVDVSVPLGSLEARGELPGIANRVFTILARTRVDEQLADADLKIVPDLEGFGFTDWRKVDQIVARGEAAAHAVADELRLLSLDPEAYARYQALRRAKPTAVDRVDAVRIELPAWIDKRIVARRVDVRPGDPIDAEKLSMAAARVYALGDFERVDWEIQRRDGRRELILRADPKPWAPDYLNFGVLLITDSGVAGFRTGLATFEAIVDLTKTRLNARGGEWRADVAFGQRIGISSELYQPIDLDGRWFVVPEAGVEKRQQPVFDGERLVAEYGVLRALAKVGVGRQFGRSAEARIGVRGGRIDAQVEAGEAASLEPLHERDGALIARFVLDRIDNVNFPHDGVLIESDAVISREILGAGRRYHRVIARIAAFRTFGRHTTFARIDGGGSLGTDLPPYEEFLLGGFLSVGGIGEGERRGDAFAAGRLGYYVRLLRLPPASRAIYIGGWMETGDAWDREESLRLRSFALSWTGAIGADTGIGPVFLAYARARGRGGRIHLAVGRAF